MSVKELPTIRWPENWRNVPLWAMFGRVKDVGHPDEEMLSVYREYGVIKKSSRDDNTNQTAENRNIYQLIDEGWLVVNRMKAWQGSVGISQLRGIVSGHYICFRPKHEEDPRFLNWLLRSDVYKVEYARMSRGVRPGQVEIDNDELRGLRIALPSLEQQRGIADFLDRETARIDALIAAKRRLGTLASGRVQSWLASQFDSHASRFGLIKVKYLVRDLKQGWSPQCEDRIPSEDEWSVLKAGAVNGGTFSPHERKALPTAEVARPEHLIRPGDLLINRANGSLDNLGSAAVVPHGVPERVLLCDKIFRARVIESHADACWLAAMLRAPQAREALLLGVSGADGMANSLPNSVVLNTFVPKVDLEYQRRFVESWLRLEADARQMIDALASSVMLLQERGAPF